MLRHLHAYLGAWLIITNPWLLWLEQSAVEDATFQIQEALPPAAPTISPTPARARQARRTLSPKGDSDKVPPPPIVPLPHDLQPGEEPPTEAELMISDLTNLTWRAVRAERQALFIGGYGPRAYSRTPIVRVRLTKAVQDSLEEA